MVQTNERDCIKFVKEIFAKIHLNNQASFNFCLRFAGIHPKAQSLDIRTCFPFQAGGAVEKSFIYIYTPEEQGWSQIHLSNTNLDFSNTNTNILLNFDSNTNTWKKWGWNDGA